jgi:hypothetical protein
MAKKLTAHQKIMRAYEANGGPRGLRLSAEDVIELGRDGAVETCAENDNLRDCAEAGHTIRRGQPACYCGENCGEEVF